MKIETFRRYVALCLANEQDEVKQDAYRGVQQLLREHLNTCAEVAYHLGYWVTGSEAETGRPGCRAVELEARLLTQRIIHAHLRDVALGLIAVELPLQVPEGQAILWEDV